MERAISETERRRKIQSDYNKAHGIIPKTIIKDIHDVIEITPKQDSEKNIKQMSREQRQQLIKKLTVEMRQAAKLLEFEHAAEIRDRIAKLQAGK